MSKNIFLIIKQATMRLLICLMMFNSAPAKERENEERRRALNDQRSDLIDEAARLNGQGLLLPSTQRQAKEVNRSMTSCLNQNRLVWYGTFATVGASVAIGNIWQADPYNYNYGAYWAVGGLVGGLAIFGSTSYFLSKKSIDIQNFMQNKCINITLGLLSFVPWIIFGVTKPVHPSTPSPSIA